MASAPAAFPGKGTVSSLLQPRRTIAWPQPPGLRRSASPSPIRNLEWPQPGSSPAAALFHPSSFTLHPSVCCLLPPAFCLLSSPGPEGRKNLAHGHRLRRGKLQPWDSFGVKILPSPGKGERHAAWRIGTNSHEHKQKRPAPRGRGVCNASVCASRVKVMKGIMQHLN